MPIEVGSVIEGKVTGIANFGAFIELPEGAVGLVHISQVSEKYVTNINEHLKAGDVVKVKVLGLNNKGKYDLSIKQATKKEFSSSMPPIARQKGRGRPKEARHPKGSFEDKITQFLKQSEEKLLDIKKNVQEKQGISKKRG
jgi:S1 RNA binding domain protein